MRECPTSVSLPPTNGLQRPHETAGPRVTRTGKEVLLQSFKQIARKGDRPESRSPIHKSVTRLRRYASIAQFPFGVSNVMPRASMRKQRKLESPLPIYFLDGGYVGSSRLLK